MLKLLHEHNMIMMNTDINKNTQRNIRCALLEKTKSIRNGNRIGIDLAFGEKKKQTIGKSTQTNYEDRKNKPTSGKRGK